MEIVRAHELSFLYPGEERPSLDGLSFTIKEGEFVVLCGPSGSGKTTLLRHLKRELTPVGEGSGTIYYKGTELPLLPPETAAGEIGMVFQNPEAQIVMETVWQELAFSMENLGLSPSVMRGRLAEMAGLFGLEPLLYKPVHELSGGQKQLVNLASVLLLHPRLLLLDEPTSQLDPVAAREFMYLLRRLNEELSMTVILSEHRLEEALPLADRVLLMEKGRIAADGSPRGIVRAAGSGLGEEHQAYLPAASRLFLALSAAAAGPHGTIPLTVREGKRWLESAAGALSYWPGPGASPRAHKPSRARETLLECREASFRYEKDGPEILKKLDFSLHRGELTAILGGNGAGKSTLLQLMAGLLKPQRGRAAMPKGVTAGYLAQNPLLYFSHDTVSEELRHMAKHAGLSASEGEREVASLTRAFGLEGVLGSHPHDISGGEQQKTALAMVLLLRPDILLLDEPTKGLDPGAKEHLAELLQALTEDGKSVTFVTHDVEFAARYASRCALLFDGSIAAEGTPDAFFGANYFYTTAVNRMVRDRLPQALTVEDVIADWQNFVSRS
ncbi:ABC transporter ATP-binding protein [Paenibacillus sabinae]|uniref:ABC transporter ATP-binding protein n=1 Tax=Paenibacillus sabinae T27 TaxID=1268072 RepID=X4ZU54_9BACL|nr:ATP-binding cassette domain-containing protein [Paenibacillus sabinae]AHV95848.1 ABC transporter ATP-binding protein [Paenibacillus sabinae T27]